jgi:hypothetical protein
LVVGHLEERLLNPERLATLLGGLLERRDAQAAKLDERLAELRRVAADADSKLTRLYAAIEAGVADPTDPNLKGRLTELKRVRDAASQDVKRAEARTGPKPAVLSPDLVKRFGAEARKRLRDKEGVSDATTSRPWCSGWRSLPTKSASAVRRRGSSKRSQRPS